MSNDLLNELYYLRESDLGLELWFLLGSHFCRFDTKGHGMPSYTARDGLILSSQMPSRDGMTGLENLPVTIPWYSLIDMDRAL